MANIEPGRPTVRMVFGHILFRLSCLELAELISTCTASHWQVFGVVGVGALSALLAILACYFSTPILTDGHYPASSGVVSSCAMPPVGILADF